MKLKLLTGAALTTVFAFAQPMAVPAMPIMPAMPADVMFYGGGMSVEMQLVKNAPFSGEFVSESVQVLADGNRITSKHTEGYARDGEGRTRREMGGAIFLHDPVAKTDWVLEPKNKIARKMMMPELAMPGKEVMVFDGVTTMATATAGPAGPAGSIGMLRTTEIRRDDGRPPGFETKNEPLGKRMIEGTESEGKRTTVTIPAGIMGNDLPLVTVSERWTSIELKTAVLTSRKDPRMGETSMRLTNLRRGEPSRILFEVPADYTIQEQPEGMMIHRMRIEKKND